MVRQHEYLMAFPGTFEREERPVRSDSVAHWRSQVESFFRHDWEKLRSLILRMEEESWDSPGNAKRPVEQIALKRITDSPSVESVLTAVQRDHGRMAEHPRTDPVREGTTVPKNNRLAELAESIEQRIRAAGSRVRES